MLKKLAAITFFIFSLALSPVWAEDQEPRMININTASAVELQKGLKYVGPKTAQKIVDFRKKNGKFQSVEGMAKVKGVSLRTIRANRTVLTIK